PARKETVRLVRKSGRRVTRAARAVDDATSEEDRFRALHEVRKAAKRARYAAEAARPVLGKDARRLARRMEDVQDLLGEVQDAHTARPLLRQLGMVANLSSENGFTFG